MSKMNNIKKATSLISPDPLMTTRRSSLPLASLDVGVCDLSVAEVVQKFKFSPRNESNIENEWQMQVPRIVIERRLSSSKALSETSLSFGNISPISLNESLLSPFSLLNSSQNQSHFAKYENENETSFKNMVRRASCGAILFTSSPDSWSKNCSWSKRVRCKSLSPIPYWNTKSPPSAEYHLAKQKERRSDESLSIRNQSYLHFPSLSPCFEDKPKSSNFSFAKSSDENCLHQLDIGQKVPKDSNEGKRQTCSKERRASLHTFVSHSSSFLHAGVLWRSDPKLRRKSFDTSSINLPECLDKNNNDADELEKGNVRLLKSSKLLTVNSIIGKGGFGIVKVGLWKGEKIAVKAIIGKKAVASFQNERKSLSIGPHLNLVRTKAVVVPENSLSARIESTSSWSEDGQNRPCVVPIKKLFSLLGVNDDLMGLATLLQATWSLVISELCTPTTLLTLINCTSNISDIDKLRIIRQIASALSHLHKAGFVHLDVKPANCFLTPSGIVKLGDFGCICRINETPTHPLGTVAYQSPEALKGETVTDRSDIYSLGVTAWQVLYRETPFSGCHPHVIIYRVTRMNHRPESNKCATLTSFIELALLSVIKRCWSEFPYERPSADSILRITAALFFSCE